MTDATSKYLLSEVSDPTDFPSDALGLHDLDDALRCSICRDFFEAPVTVNCPQGHCFCSLCIRNAITTKDECPSCREKIQEVHIRRNPAMEDAIRAWNTARPFVLAILKDGNELARLRGMEKGLREKMAQTKKRKRTPESDDDVVEIVAPSLSNAAKARPSSSGSSTPSSDLGDCPICNKRVPLASINEHVDDHLDLSIKVPATPPKNKGKQKQEWSKFFQGAGRSPSGPSKNKGKTKSPEEILGEPLPRLAYDTLKLKRLRELLEEHNLSTAGDRPVLAARHAQWVNMYNANLDAAPGARKNQKQLRWELQQWDEVEERRRAKGKVHKDLDPQAYQRENRAAFARLVEAAKPKRPEKTSKTLNGGPAVEFTRPKGAQENGHDSGAEDGDLDIERHSNGPPSSVVDIDMGADEE